MCPSLSDIDSGPLLGRCRYVLPTFDRLSIDRIFSAKGVANNLALSDLRAQTLARAPR